MCIDKILRTNFRGRKRRRRPVLHECHDQLPSLLQAVGFSDPDFWGQYNIIEPEKSIESAIRKIQRQLRRARAKNGSAAP